MYEAFLNVRLSPQCHYYQSNKVPEGQVNIVLHLNSENAVLHVLREYVRQGNGLVNKEKNHGYLGNSDDEDAENAVCVKLSQVVVVPLLNVTDSQEGADKQHANEQQDEGTGNYLRYFV